MRTLLPLAALCVAVGFTATAGAEDLKGLEGLYTIVSGEENGKAIPAERIKGAVVRITKDEMIGTDKEKKQIFVAKYTVDTSKTPHTLKMRSTAPKESEALGLIKRDADTVTIVYALPGGKPPGEFKAGDRQQLFVLKSAKKGKGEKGSSP